MSNKCVTHGDTDFDPYEYINLNYLHFDPNDLSNTQHQMRVFIIKSLFDIYNTGNVSGELLLDIGCGPVCFSSVLASSSVKEIVLADNSDKNLDILRKWKAGSNDHQKSIIAFIAETIGSRYTWNQIDRVMADKVTNIIKGDIRSSNPLFGSNREDTVFDIITVILALSIASQNEREYIQSVRNLSQRLRRGGHIIVADTVEKPSYTVGAYTFRAVLVSATSVQKLFIDNGFDVLEWIEAPFNENNTAFKCFCMLARKR